MRIVHIDFGKEMRGGQWQMLRLLRGLRTRGVDSILVAPPGSPVSERAAREGFPVQKPRWTLPAADLVHAHDARGHTIAALRSRTPVVVSRRVAFPIKSGMASKWKYRRAAHYIAVSNYVAGILMAAGIPSSKISVVYDGVPMLAPSTRTGGVVELAKSASNLEQDLRHARLVVYLTEAEGLGSGALLAASAGVPVIASRIGGLPEAVEDGVTGMLVDSAEEAAAAVRRLEADPIEIQRLGDNARRRIEDRFTVERMVDETFAVYRRMLNAH